MATSRRTATNENIGTYGGSGQGRDYTSVGTWEAATDIDLVSATQSEILECYDDEVSFDESNINIQDAITNTSYFRILRPAGTIGTGGWQGNDGTPNNGVYFLSAVDATMFEIGEANSSIQDIIVEWSSASTANRIALPSDGGNNLWVGVILKGSTNATADARGFSIRGDSDVMVNCLAQDVDRFGIDLNANNVGQKVYAFNCNSINNVEEGFVASNGETNSAVAVNCIADGNGLDDFEDPSANAQWDLTNSRNNASGDATGADFTSGRGSQTFTFVNAGNDDFHLANNDAGAKGFAFDLSATGPFQFDDDIDGDTRS